MEVRFNLKPSDRYGSYSSGKVTISLWQMCLQEESIRFLIDQISTTLIHELCHKYVSRTSERGIRSAVRSIFDDECWFQP